MIRLLIVTAIAALVFLTPAAARAAPSANLVVHEGDYLVQDFRFGSGERLPVLRLHYVTLGTPRRDAAGHVTNAVLILHGTGGSGASLLRPSFAGELFGPGQPLDAQRYYVILPDDIGHGLSSKPSDGLHARFPRYSYADMVEAEHRLVTERLRVDHLRLVMGTSMGCMHSFMWGERWPDQMDALMPLACLPAPITGRNRLWRAMIIDAIRNDPDWKGGEYASEPRQALRAASDILTIAGSAPLQMQQSLPTADKADQYLATIHARDLAELDANDLLYQIAASGDYDPSAGLGEIKAPVMWINSADDFINPPELGVAEREAARLKRGRFVLLPIGPDTHGHGTHSWAVAWKTYLDQLLAQSEPIDHPDARPSTAPGA